MDNGKYEILSGHNRVYAAGQAGITSVPAVVKTDLSDEEAEVYVIETNLLQRSFPHKFDHPPDTELCRTDLPICCHGLPSESW